MTVQETAFRNYYASLTDGELMKIAANRSSYIAVAQEALAREMRLRNLQADDGGSREGKG